MRFFIRKCSKTPHVRAKPGCRGEVWTDTLTIPSSDGCHLPADPFCRTPYERVCLPRKARCRQENRNIRFRGYDRVYGESASDLPEAVCL